MEMWTGCHFLHQKDTISRRSDSFCASVTRLVTAPMTENHQETDGEPLLFLERPS